MAVKMKVGGLWIVTGTAGGFDWREAYFMSEEQADWAMHIFTHILEVHDLHMRTVPHSSGSWLIEVHAKQGPTGSEDEYVFKGWALRVEHQPKLERHIVE